jgi:NCS1 family nucleobase:cation symporter-1
LEGWLITNHDPHAIHPTGQTQRPFIVMNTISFIMLVSMMLWALSKAHETGPLLSPPATASSGSELGWGIVKGVTTVIGGIAVGLNKCTLAVKFTS